MSSSESQAREGGETTLPPTTPSDGEAGFLCRRCHQANPRLEKPPFASALGKRIHETICRSCWKEWFAMSIRVINEYRLNLMQPEASAIYDEQMKQFLGIADVPRTP